MQRELPEVEGWVLYDDSCGFCRRWVPFWERTLRRAGLGIDTLQGERARTVLDLPPEELASDLRLLLRDGGSLSGPDVYRFALRRIGWARPFYWLSIAPGLRRVFDGAYRSFARNRYRVSRACRLPGAQRKR